MKALFFVLVGFLVPVSLSAEPIDEKLREAAALYDRAGELESSEQLEAYEVVRNLLDRIVNDHPTSNVAVSILLSETVEGIDIEALDAYLVAGGVGVSPPSRNFDVRGTEEEITVSSDLEPTSPPTSTEGLTSGELERLRHEVGSCWNVGSLSANGLETTVVVGLELAPNGVPVPNSVLLLESSGGSAEDVQQAFEAAKRAIVRCGANGFSLPSDKYDHWKRMALTFDPEGLWSRNTTSPASRGSDTGQTLKAETQARSEKEIALDVQAELNRLGCAAGPADGIVGRKTRTAFANFIRDSGVNLSVDSLLTEEAVDVLKAQAGTVCKVRTMASTPASALTGGWGFRSECPGIGSRIIRNSGSMKLAYQGNNTLRGPVRSKEGLSGSATIQFQGSRTAATVIRFGFLTLRGNLTRSTSNMTISGTGSKRCKIVAWKN